MKAYFEGEKNVLVFKPLPGKKRGRTKRRTNEDYLKNMETKELAHELAMIADWDREQLEKARKGPGLDAFMERWLHQPAKEDGHGER